MTDNMFLGLSILSYALITISSLYMLVLGLKDNTGFDKTQFKILKYPKGILRLKVFYVFYILLRIVIITQIVILILHWLNVLTFSLSSYSILLLVLVFSDIVTIGIMLIMTNKYFYNDEKIICSRGSRFFEVFYRDITVIQYIPSSLVILGKTKKDRIQLSSKYEGLDDFTRVLSNNTKELNNSSIMIATFRVVSGLTVHADTVRMVIVHNSKYLLCDTQKSKLLAKGQNKYEIINSISFNFQDLKESAFTDMLEVDFGLSVDKINYLKVEEHIKTNELFTEDIKYVVVEVKNSHFKLTKNLSNHFYEWFGDTEFEIALSNHTSEAKVEILNKIKNLG